MNNKKELFMGSEKTEKFFAGKFAKIAVFALIGVAAFAIVSAFMNSLIRSSPV